MEQQRDKFSVIEDKRKEESILYLNILVNSR